MKLFEMMRGQNFRALVSRMNPYRFSLDEEDLEKIAEGYEIFKLDEKLQSKAQKEVTITRPQYMRIKSLALRAMKKTTDNNAIRKELMLRTIGDCCRITAVTGKIDTKHVNNLVTWKIHTQQDIGKYFENYAKNPSDITKPKWKEKLS